MNKSSRRLSAILIPLMLFFAHSERVLLGQTPDFMSRLAGGRISGKNFKEVIDFTFVGGRICIPVRLNDEEQQRRFILDTYAVCLVREDLLSIRGLDILDLTSQLGSAFEKTPMMPVLPKFNKIRLGQVVFEDIGAMTLRSSSGNAIASVLEDGLMGANLMKQCIWQIDFQKQKILLTDRIESCGGLENAIRIPFTPKPIQSSPDIQIVVNGTEKVNVQFDTGSTGFLSFLTPSLKTLVESGMAVAWRASLDHFIEDPSAAGIETNHFVMAPSIRIGSRDFHDVPVAVFDPSKAAVMNRGSLGVEFLKNFVVTMDWTAQMIYLAPIKGRELKKNIRTFGFTYGYEDGAMRVRSLYAGSKAEKSGIRIGDRIFSINGTSVENLTESEVLRFLKGDLTFSKDEDKHIDLDVLAGGKRTVIRLAAYQLFRR